MVNKKKLLLNYLDFKERVTSFFIWVFLILFLLVLTYFLTQEQKNRIVEFKSYTKIKETGIYLGQASSKGGVFCSIELKNRKIIVLQCNPYESHYFGQKVKLLKIIKPTGQYYFKIEDGKNF